jgi:peptidoglycan/LPS O-acetylase OafA/YrhL
LFDSLKSFSYLAIYMLTGSRYWAVDVAGYDPYTMLGFFKPYYPSGVLWTITVELSFYLILPVFLEIWRRWNKAGVALIMVSAGLSWVMSRHFNLTDKYDEVISTTIAPHFCIFSLGVLARLHWDSIRGAFESKVLWWLAAHSVFTAATSVYLPLGSVTPGTPIDGLRLVCLAGLVLSAAYSFPRPDLLRKQDLSYGIYLYHMLVIHTLLALGFVGQWWLCVVTPIAVVGLAAISWWLVEKPTMKLRTSLVNKRLSVA